MTASRAKESLDGWLISPKGDYCYRFYNDPKSWETFPLVFVDKWTSQADGSPSCLKKRSKLPLEEALEMCGNMLLDGWRKLETQFGESTAPPLKTHTSS